MQIDLKKTGIHCMSEMLFISKVNVQRYSVFADVDLRSKRKKKLRKNTTNYMYGNVIKDLNQFCEQKYIVLNIKPPHFN